MNEWTKNRMKMIVVRHKRWKETFAWLTYRPTERRTWPLSEVRGRTLKKHVRAEPSLTWCRQRVVSNRLSTKRQSNAMTVESRYSWYITIGQHLQCNPFVTFVHLSFPLRLIFISHSLWTSFLSVRLLPLIHIHHRSLYPSLQILNFYGLHHFFSPKLHIFSPFPPHSTPCHISSVTYAVSHKPCPKSPLT